MNHWYLCLLDIWWVVRWVVPAFAGWAWIEFLKSFIRKESHRDDDFSLFLFLSIVLGAAYYFSMQSLGAG